MEALSTRQLAIMTFANIRLAIPLAEIASIERTSQVQPGSAHSLALGELRYRDRRYPVYGLSARLEPLMELPTQHPLCACIDVDGTALALVCAAVTRTTLDRTTLLHAIPECMQRTGSPLQAFVKQAQRLVLVSTARALGAYLHSKEESSP